MMKILNLYSGLGGNRKLWSNEHQVTAVENDPSVAQFYADHFPNDIVIVGDAHEYLLHHYHEFDYIWSSPPCPSHSRARFWASRPNDKVKPIYPDMRLYEEILFLKNYFDGKWSVENVVPYYDPLIDPTRKLGRHLFWCNFELIKFDSNDADCTGGDVQEWQELHGFDISSYKFDQRRDKILRNCVEPELGRHVLECAINIEEVKTNLKQMELAL